MEILLAIVVAFAVIFFGALISIGNERQRKAIDGLREQTVLWAMQDLRIKRERLARDARVDDPLAWLSAIASKACGYSVKLQVIEVADKPNALICAIEEDGSRIVFSPQSPKDIRRILHSKRNRLLRYADGNPLLPLARDGIVHELSVLNGGILFDIELPLAWNALTGQNAEHLERLWVYLLE